MDWWNAADDNDPAAKNYLDYYNSIKHELPSKMVEFESLFSLHDSRIKGISINYISKELVLNLKGWDQHFENQKNYEVKFTDIQSSDFKFSDDEDLSSPEFGDLGYWEHELDDSNFAFRCIFSSGATFSVLYRDFEYKALEA